MGYTRRRVLAGMALAPLGMVTPARAKKVGQDACPFRLAVISDEITQDFEKACQIMSGLGLRWIELRELWNKNVSTLDANELEVVRRLLKKYKLQVTDIASPLFKTDWPGAPRAPHANSRDRLHSDFGADAQDQILERCISFAKTLGTDRIRCFDFWRLEDQTPYRAAIDARLRQAAERCAKDNIILLLENEPTCNTATAKESAAMLKAVPNRNFMLSWDPANAAVAGDIPYPTGYELLPKDRIGHCGCKDLVRHPDGKHEWVPLGEGIVDWVGQLQALQHDDYRYGLSLEAHARGAGAREQSTRISMEALRKMLTNAGMRC